MKIHIITLFPDMFKGPFDMSMMWKAQDRGLAQIKLWDLRDAQDFTGSLIQVLQVVQGRLQGGHR